MNINYCTSISGEYTLYDEDMNVLCETNNLITDWGMRRFVGDRSTGSPHPADMDQSQQAFCYNITKIVLGTGTTPASATDWQLESMVPLSSFVDTNEPATTGTTLSSDSSENLVMVFTKLSRLKFADSFIDAAEYNIKEIGCSWSTTFSADNRYGIFSRAILPSVVKVKPKNTIFAKYVLTITTNANKIITMPHLSGTGASTFPNNKTNVRVLPLYTLRSNGTPSHVLNNVASLGYRYFTNYTLYDDSLTISSATEYVPPILEDPGLHNVTSVSKGTSNDLFSCDYGANGQDGTLGGKYRRKRWLQMYTSEFVQTGALSATHKGAYPAERYQTFVSTTTAAIGHGNVNINNQGGSYGIYNPPSTATYNFGSSDYATVIEQNLNYLKSAPNRYGRKPADSDELERTNNNTWKRTIRFLFTPGEFKQKTTVLNFYSATLEDWNYDCTGYVNYDVTGPHNFGVVTVFDSEYLPNPNHFIGFEYNFTFTRN